MKFNTRKSIDVNYSCYSGVNKFKNIKDIISINKVKKQNKNNNNNEKKKSNESDDESTSSENQLVLNNLNNLIKKKNTEDVKIQRDNNHIYFYSEVNRDNIYDLCSLIKEAEEESILVSYKLNIDEIPIYLHISSEGGSVYAALNAIDVINSCRVPVYSIVEGATASAGTLISVVSKKRFIRPNAYMLIHQLSASCWGKMNEIEDEYNNLKNLMDKIRELYTANTNIPKKELTSLLNKDLWLNSEKCIQYGLADEIWNK